MRAGRNVQIPMIREQLTPCQRQIGLNMFRQTPAFREKPVFDACSSCGYRTLAMRAGAIFSLMLATALSTPLPWCTACKAGGPGYSNPGAPRIRQVGATKSSPCPCRGARAPRGRRWTRPREPPRGRRLQWGRHVRVNLAGSII